MEQWAFVFSLLALLISAAAYLRVQKEFKVHEQKVAASLETALDELEAENRQFIEALQNLQQETLRQQEKKKDEPPLPHPGQFQETAAKQETGVQQGTASTFQTLLKEVLAMKQQGRSDAEIARQMNRGVGEIQFILQSAAYQQKKQS